MARPSSKASNSALRRRQALPTPPLYDIYGVLTLQFGYRGVINSFGVFQSYYVDFLQRPPSDISWIGSIGIFCLFLIGIFSGALTDAGFFYPTVICGTGLITLGSLATSASTTYWQILLAQGVCAGLGNGLLFCPALSVVSTYFSWKRSLAIGIAACGTSTGGVLFPLLARQLLPTIGFAWTMRIIGIIQAVVLGIAVICLKPRVPPRPMGAILEWAAFCEPEYLLYGFGSFLVGALSPLSVSQTN